jgi:hypothetical protein
MAAKVPRPRRGAAQAIGNRRRVQQQDAGERAEQQGCREAVGDGAR